MEPNQPNAATWKSIMEYVKSELLKQVAPMMYPQNQYPTDAVARATVFSIPQLITLDGYLKANELKKVKKVVQIDPVYKEAWKAFWNLWPSTKSVPGTQMKSGAKMKSDEIKMYGKWLAAIESGKISIEVMYKTADTYLQWGYEDSKKNGRNELLYRNSMEPWMNQESYLVYMDVAPPRVQTQVKEVVYNNSTDQ